MLLKSFVTFEIEIKSFTYNQSVLRRAMLWYNNIKNFPSSKEQISCCPFVYNRHSLCIYDLIQSGKLFRGDSSLSFKFQLSSY